MDVKCGLDALGDKAQARKPVRTGQSAARNLKRHMVNNSAWARRLGRRRGEGKAFRLQARDLRVKEYLVNPYGE